MEPGKMTLVWTLKLVLLFILTVATFVIIGVNITFDFTWSSHYLAALNPLSPVVKTMKWTDYDGTYDDPGNLSQLEQMKGRTLSGPLKLRESNDNDIDRMNESEVNAKADEAHIKKILWYNKPVWIDVFVANDKLKNVCPYRNCRMTSDREAKNIKNYSAVIFTLTSPMERSEAPVNTQERDPDQAWIFFGLESPVHTSRIWYRHYSWGNSMNWSMSYRTDADIFFPYGVLVPREKPLIRDYRAMYRAKTKQVAWAVSNCGAPSRRDEYVEEMRATDLQVDVYGRCTEGTFSDQSRIKDRVSPHYLFYLSFENSLCTDYITEKFFRYFEWDVVLVVRGGADYQRLLPNDTYIDASDFSSAAELAGYLLLVGQSEELYTQYLKAKDKYKVDAYPGTTAAWCNICDKLNNLDRNRKSIVDHVTYIHRNQCHDADDIHSIPNLGLMLCIGGFISACVSFAWIRRKRKHNKADKF